MAERGGIYAGTVQGGGAVTFRASNPSKATRNQYRTVYGPFRTLRAARYVARFWWCHFDNIAQAERLAAMDHRHDSRNRKRGRA